MITVEKRQRNVKQNDMRLKFPEVCHYISEIVDFFGIDAPRCYLRSDLFRDDIVVLDDQHFIYFLASFPESQTG